MDNFISIQNLNKKYSNNFIAIDFPIPVLTPVIKTVLIKYLFFINLLSIKLELIFDFCIIKNN